MLIVEQIKNLIEEGKLKPGDRMPSERDLASEFQISRPTVREALTALEVLGFIEIKSGVGTFVCNKPQNDNDLHSIEEELLKSTSPSALFEARMIIEPLLARLASQRATEEDIHEMIELLEKADGLSTDQWEEFEELDVAFHSLIAKASNNQVLYKFEESVNHERMGILWKELKARDMHNKGYIEKYKTEHYAIVNAIKSRNSEAAERLTREHLYDIWKHIFE